MTPYDRACIAERILYECIQARFFRIGLTVKISFRAAFAAGGCRSLAGYGEFRVNDDQGYEIVWGNKLVQLCPDMIESA